MDESSLDLHEAEKRNADIMTVSAENSSPRCGSADEEREGLLD
jgi:hypothetical protein